MGAGVFLRLCVSTCEVLRPCLVIESMQTDRSKRQETWGKRGECTAVMGPGRLYNSAQTGGENHVKGAPNWLLGRDAVESTFKPLPWQQHWV